MEKKNRESVYRITLDITQRCNLKCKLCAAHVPYFKEPWHPTYEYLTRTIDKMFELVPTMERLVIAGGEPLIRADIADLFKYLLPHKERINSRVELITNGSILPSKELLEVCQKFTREEGKGQGIYFIVDNYGPTLSPKLYEIGDLLSQYNIPHELRDYYKDLHCDGWVDFGDFTLKRTPEEGKKIFQKCAFPNRLNFCIKIFDGRIDPCSQSMHCMKLGLFDEPAEYINLFDDETSIEEKREKILSWYNLETLRACQYCDGMCEDSKRFRPAEQLSKEEIKEIMR